MTRVRGTGRAPRYPAPMRRCPRVPDATALACLVLLGLLVAVPFGHAARRPARPPLPSQAVEDLAVGRLLVASRQIATPPFAESVVLLLDHGPAGAVGLIVNVRTELRLRNVLTGVEGLADRVERVWFGGPVDLGRTFLLIPGEEPPVGAVKVVDGVHASSDPQTLEALLGDGKEAGPQFRAYIGYAGWGPRQLEGELERGDWYVVPAEARLVFADEPDGVWRELLLRSEGVQVRAPTDRVRIASAPGEPRPPGEP